MLHKLGVMDFEAVYSSDPEAKVLNCYNQMTLTPASSEAYLKEIFQDGSSELNFIASCDCGHLTGNFFENSICPICKSAATTGFSDKLNYKFWLEIPDIFPPVLHPVAYKILSIWLGTGNGKKNWTLSSLLDVNTDYPTNEDKVIGQGFKYFYENFDDIMVYLINKKNKTADGRRRTAHIPEFIKENRHKLFVRHLPLLNQSMHVIISSHNNRRNTDAAAACVLKAFSDLSTAVYSHTKLTNSHTYLNDQLLSVYSSMLEYIEMIISKKLEGKEGLFRANILGSRLHNTFRAVVVPNVKDHMCDEFHVPWKIGVSNLKLEILNLLINRRNYTLPDALEKHSKAMVAYDEDIDNIFKELIAETPYKGLPVTVGRNPC
jgi:hypothetical protein